jgi:hypothetical protein
MALTLLHLAGLLLVLSGERVFADRATVRIAFAAVGGGAVLVALLLRARMMTRAEGNQRRVERWLLGTHAFGCAGLLLYALGTSELLDGLGVLIDGAGRQHYQGVLRILYSILLLGSVVSLGFAVLAYHPMRQARMIEAGRVRAAGLAGLELVLAAALLCVVGFIVSERDVKIDASYFRTSMPSGTTRNLVASFSEPLDFVLFFPDVSETRNEVLSYVHSLGVRPVIHDRMAEPKLAEKYKVREDGILVLALPTRQEIVYVGVDVDRSRTQLRTLDESVQRALLKLKRGRRTVYETTGHGEIGDRNQAPGEQRPMLGDTALYGVVEKDLHLTVRQLGVGQGLANDVPNDAGVVLLLGPRNALLPEEQQALIRYLDRGGHLLMALDASAALQPEELLQRLGLRFLPTPLANDKMFARRSYTESDHGLVVTTEFSSHYSVLTLSLAAGSLATVFDGAGALEKLPNPGGNDIHFSIKSPPDTFADVVRNFRFDAAKEKRGTYNLCAVVTRDASKVANNISPETRAIVLANAVPLSDAGLNQLGNTYLATDGIRWLIGEEFISGASTSEEDVRIEHTSKQDVFWFYGTIFGFPAFVLAGGLFYARRSRRE